MSAGIYVSDIVPLIQNVCGAATGHKYEQVGEPWEYDSEDKQCGVIRKTTCTAFTCAYCKHDTVERKETTTPIPMDVCASCGKPNKTKAPGARDNPRLVEISHNAVYGHPFRAKRGKKVGRK